VAGEIRELSESSAEVKDDADEEPKISGALKESIFVVEMSCTGDEIWCRKMCCPFRRVLAARFGGSEPRSGRLLRLVNARARDIFKWWVQRSCTGVVKAGVDR